MHQPLTVLVKPLMQAIKTMTIFSNPPKTPRYSFRRRLNSRTSGLGRSPLLRQSLLSTDTKSISHSANNVTRLRSRSRRWEYQSPRRIGLVH